MRTHLLILLLTMTALVATACGSSTDTADSATGPGVRVATATDAAELIDAEPDRTVIDIRTPQEYAEGHVAGAELIDFYEPDFADQIGELDRDASYVIYCRSGNRSAQARQLMTDLGFTDVVDVQDGIVGWTAAGLPVQQ